MENYTPTQQDILFAKQVNDEIIWKQVLNPALIKQAFKGLFGFDAVNPSQAKSKVFSYFQYEYKPFENQPKDEYAESYPSISNSMGTIENLPFQSHQENINEELPLVVDYEKKLELLQEELRFMQNCEDSSDNDLIVQNIKAEIKSIKIKISKQKNK